MPPARTRRHPRPFGVSKVLRSMVGARLAPPRVGGRTECASAAFRASTCRTFSRSALALLFELEVTAPLDVVTLSAERKKYREIYQQHAMTGCRSQGSHHRTVEQSATCIQQDINQQASHTTEVFPWSYQYTPVLLSTSNVYTHQIRQLHCGVDSCSMLNNDPTIHPHHH